MHWQCAQHKISLNTPVIIGILNATPDSFSDGGLYVDADKAIAHCERMIAEGAGIIDVGGESTRPGAKAVSVQEELDRVIPIISALAKKNIAKKNIVVSVDTSQPQVMQVAIEAGASIVNDVRALK